MPVTPVQIEGQVTFRDALNTNDFTVIWETSLGRLKHEEWGPNLTDARQKGLRFTQSLSLKLLFLGDQGWSVRNGKVSVLKGDYLISAQDWQYGFVLSNLIPLMQKGFVIGTIEDTVVRGKSCFGATVKLDGRPEMKMFFDKETALLGKAELRLAKVYDWFQGRYADKETLVEFYFDNYRVTDGVNHWGTADQWRNGREYSHSEISRVRFFTEVDDSLFYLSELHNPWILWLVLALIGIVVVLIALRMKVLLSGFRAGTKLGRRRKPFRMRG